MEGASSLNTSATLATSTSTAGGPSRGAYRGGHRNGRGGGRGRGRSGGRGRGRGDGRGNFRGGGRGYVPKKAVRHRSLSGKYGTHPGQDGAPSAKREKKEQKPNSNFALLHSMLGDAAMIAEYIREYHASEKFRDAKSVNTFLQAISQRPEKVYEELMANHKDEVFTTLERLFAVYALGKQTMFPPAHEFLIRCEREGVHKTAWGEGVKTLPEKTSSTEENSIGGNSKDREATSPAPFPLKPVAPTLPPEATSLLSPRELLKKMAALDPVGRLQRRIELAQTVEEVHACAEKLVALTNEGEATFSVNNNAAEKFDFAAKCQLISKLLSKARRLVEPTFTSPPKNDEDTENRTSNKTAVVIGNEADAREEEEDEEHEGDGQQKQEESSPSTGNNSDVRSTATVATRATTAASQQRRLRGPLTNDEIHTFQFTLSTALHVLEDVLKNRPANATQQPLSKFSKLLEWYKTRGLLASDDERFITVLEQEAENDIAEQATQLETVINLKTLTAGDTAALTQVANQLWAAGKGKCFAPSSVDVLSAIAVAAAADGIAADVKRLIADRLVQTQHHLAETVALPRRALRFVNEERSKVKQAAIAKQLEEAAADSKTAGGEECVEEIEEEEDMALEEA